MITVSTKELVKALNTLKAFKIQDVSIFSESDSAVLTGLSESAGVTVKIASDGELNKPITFISIKDVMKLLDKDSAVTTLKMNDTLHVNGFYTSLKGYTDNELSYEMFTAENYQPVSASVFDDVLARVMTHAADNESRPILYSVKWEYDGTDLTLVACDGYRLAIETVNQPFNLDAFDFVLPLNAMKGILKTFKGKTVSIAQGESALYFTADNVSVKIEALEGKYPNYRAISDEFHIDYTVSLENMPAFKVDKNAPHIKFSFENGNMLVSLGEHSNYSGFTTYRDIAVIPSESYPFASLAFNALYLQESMQYGNAMQLKTHTDYKGNPYYVARFESENGLSIIMPMSNPS
jgi:DNA polymerase III sliding clamp (beta) subunit (PCNA family)